MDIKFISGVEVETYTVTGVPVSETDAIVLKQSATETAGGTATALISGNTQATLYIKYVLGSATNALIKFYGSPLRDPTASDWYSETIASVSSGAITLTAENITMTADTTAMYHFPVGGCKSYKLTVTGAGTTTGSSLDLYLGLRVN